MPREWDTPLRHPWNPVIHHLLKAVDHHNNLLLSTGDRWHAVKAEQLRQYVRELKDWIHQQEAGDVRST